MGAVIKKCTCVSEFQDRMYGKGNRVMNSTGKLAMKEVKHRCTICKAIV